MTTNDQGAGAGDKVFTGSISQLYDTHLVPLIFEPYAADLVSRLASNPLTRVLEVAAGTGVVTRRLASGLPAGVSIVATASVCGDASCAEAGRRVHFQCVGPNRGKRIHRHRDDRARIAVSAAP